MHLSRALSALLAASVLTACATSAAAPSHTPTPVPTPPQPLSTVAPPLSDAQIARRGLVRQGDFPKGWKVNRSANDRLQCKSTSAAKKAASATARGRAFASGPNTEMQSDAYVYKSVKAAQRQTNNLGGSATTSCMVRALKRVFADAHYRIGTIATAPLDLAQAG